MVHILIKEVPKENAHHQEILHQILAKAKTIRVQEVEDPRQNNDSINNPLKNLLDDFYETTSKISELIRNFAFAGIGIIWIFKNSDLSQSLLPQDLKFPLLSFIMFFLHDIAQYFWRGISFYMIYKRKEKLYDSNVLKSRDIEDIVLPDIVEFGSWSFFIFKLFYFITAYWSLYNFLNI